jgi:hypothetical protein
MNALIKGEGLFGWHKPGDSSTEHTTPATLEISAEGVSTLSIVGILGKTERGLQVLPVEVRPTLPNHGF